MYKTLIWPWQNENWRTVPEATLVGDTGIWAMHLIQAFWSCSNSVTFSSYDRPSEAPLTLCLAGLTEPSLWWAASETWLLGVCACELSRSVVFDSLQPCGHCSLPGSSVHGDSPGKNTGLEYAMLFSRGSSKPWDWTHTSCIFCINSWILSNNPTWEALVTWYSMEILLHLPGLSHLQEAASQKEYNSPLLLAWPWSRTLGDCVRILLLGLVLKPHWNSFTHLLFKHNWDGSSDSNGRAVWQQPKFSAAPFTAFGSTQFWHPFVFPGISVREVDLHVKPVASRTQQPLQALYFLLCNKVSTCRNLFFIL